MTDRPDPTPEAKALERIAATAARAPDPVRMRGVVIGMAMDLRIQHGREAAAEMLRTIHAEMIEAVAAGVEAIEDMDQSDEKGLEHSRKSLAVLEAARDAAEREADAPC